AHRELTLEGERPFVAQGFREGLALGSPIEETRKARSVQRDIAAERLPAGRIGDGAIECEARSTGQPDAQLVEQQRASAARHLELHAAHRFPTEARLIEVEAYLAVGILRQ